jgi:dUTP pyrophosphatase
MKQIKVKLLNENSKLPKRFIDNDACYDVYAVSKNDLGDGRIEYGLGLAFEIPENTQLDFRPRSSIHKTGLILSNCIVTGDEGYRGEYKSVFYHVIKSLPPYEVGDRILQLQLRTREDVVFEVVENLTDTVRGDGGFGSTGK